MAKSLVFVLVPYSVGPSNVSSHARRLLEPHAMSDGHRGWYERLAKLGPVWDDRIAEGGLPDREKRVLHRHVCDLSRLPPEEIRWLATSGIMVTSEPVRDRMVALTRSISAATSLTSASIEASSGVSKGTITATAVSTFAILDTTIESAAQGGKCRKAADAHADVGEFQVAGIGSDQRHGTGFGYRCAA